MIIPSPICPIKQTVLFLMNLGSNRIIVPYNSILPIECPLGKLVPPAATRCSPLGLGRLNINFRAVLPAPWIIAELITNQMAATLFFSKNHKTSANPTVKIMTVEVSPRRVTVEKNNVLVVVKLPRIAWIIGLSITLKIVSSITTKIAIAANNNKLI